jgi:polar amino acid transport system substrate-binding protein
VTQSRSPRRRHLMLGASMSALAAVIILSGCSSSDPAPTSAEATASAPLASALPDQIRSAGEVTIATTNFAPANYTTPGSNTMQGFNIEIAEAMAKQLGVRVTWANVPFDAQIPGVQSGKYDSSVAAMTDNKTREEQVDFMDYLSTGSVLVVPKGNPQKVTGAADGACGLRVSSMIASDEANNLKLMEAACKAAGRPAPKPVSFASAADKQLGLASGRVDAIFWADMSVAPYVEQVGDQIDVVPLTFTPRSTLGMIFTKQNAQLRDAFLTAMKAIQADGTYDSILAKWKVTSIKLDNPGINLAGKA